MRVVAGWRVVAAPEVAGQRGEAPLPGLLRCPDNKQSAPAGRPVQRWSDLRPARAGDATSSKLNDVCNAYYVESIFSLSYCCEYKVRLCIRFCFSLVSWNN